MRVEGNVRSTDAIVALRLDLEQAIAEAYVQGEISGDQLMALYLRYVYVWTTDRIAEFMGVRPRTVLRRLERALEAIRATGRLEGYLNE